MQSGQVGHSQLNVKPHEQDQSFGQIRHKPPKPFWLKRAWDPGFETNFFASYARQRCSEIVYFWHPRNVRSTFLV
ncbi:hypothetical protein D6745_04395, partial [Candidatus Woesearchaeota archaeon]